MSTPDSILKLETIFCEASQGELESALELVSSLGTDPSYSQLFHDGADDDKDVNARAKIRQAISICLNIDLDDFKEEIWTREVQLHPCF